MTGKHGFLDALKQVAFEEEPAPQEKHTAPTVEPNSTLVPSAAAATASPFAAVASSSAYAPSISTAIDAGVVPDNDAVYQMLQSKTDFEGTTTAATIHKFLDPLKAIPDTVMPVNVKFRTAVLQASAQAGLT
ncbi:MAG: hypothetical protein WBQ94_05220, partial [Terracidiphilus sp.]